MIFLEIFIDFIDQFMHFFRYRNGTRFTRLCNLDTNVRLAATYRQAIDIGKIIVNRGDLSESDNLVGISFNDDALEFFW